MGVHSGTSGEHDAAFNKPGVVVINPHVKIDVVNVMNLAMLRIGLNSDARM